MKAITLNEVVAIAQAPATELWQKRIRAAAVLLFLSGMRVGALVSLPLKTIDLASRTVKQWPSLGVRTKFGKRATTYLLDIPALIDVVAEGNSSCAPLRRKTDLGLRHSYATAEA